MYSGQDILRIAHLPMYNHSKTSSVISMYYIHHYMSHEDPLSIRISMYSPNPSNYPISSSLGLSVAGRAHQLLAARLDAAAGRAQRAAALGRWSRWSDRRDVGKWLAEVWSKRVALFGGFGGVLKWGYLQIIHFHIYIFFSWDVPLSKPTIFWDTSIYGTPHL